MDHSTSATFLFLGRLQRVLNGTIGSSTTSKIFSTEGACEYSSRCKFLDASLKLSGRIFDPFNIDLTEVKELENCQTTCLIVFAFGSSFPKEIHPSISSLSNSTSDFLPIIYSIICFKGLTGLKCLSNAIFQSATFFMNWIARFRNPLR